MAILNVPNAVASGTAPTERQLDIMRSYLLNFFNGGQLDENNIATGGISYAKIGAAPDDVSLKFADGAASLSFVSEEDRFLIQSVGDIVFGVKDASVYNLRINSAGTVFLKGTYNFNAAIGNQSVTSQWLLTKYRKPKLVYSTSDIVTIEANGTTSTQTLVAMPDRVCTIYDRTCSLAATANGYLATHTGTAVSGLSSGLTRTDNRWYYIYSVLVQGGTQNDGANAILVAHTTPPVMENVTTIDSYFGEDKWEYIGCIRNGYNDGETDDDIILPFAYDDSGFCRFYTASDTNEGAGPTMTEALTTANLEYEMTSATGTSASIPQTATRILFSGHREANGFEFHFRSIANDQNYMIATGCYHITGLSTLQACVHLEVPVLENYKLVVTNGNVETYCRITIAGFMDHYA